MRKYIRLAAIVSLVFSTVFFTGCTHKATGLSYKEIDKLEAVSTKALLDLNSDLFSDAENFKEFRNVEIFGIGEYAEGLISKNIIFVKENTYQLKTDFWYKIQNQYGDNINREGNAIVILSKTGENYFVDEIELKDSRKLSFVRQLFRCALWSVWFFIKKIYIIIILYIVLFLLYAKVGITNAIVFNADYLICLTAAMCIVNGYFYYIGFGSIIALAVAIILTLLGMGINIILFKKNSI